MQAIDFQLNSYRNVRLLRPLKQPCAFAFHFTASGRTNRTSLQPHLGHIAYLMTGNTSHGRKN